MSRFTEHQLTDLGLLKNGISELLVSERTLYKNNLTAAHIFSAATDKDGKDANKGKKKTIKNIYLQINSKAKNESLKNFRGKHKSHGNLASATINPQTQRAQRSGLPVLGPKPVQIEAIQTVHSPSDT